MSDDELFASWGSWIRRTATELIDVYHNRQVFLSIKEMHDLNPLLHDPEHPDRRSVSSDAFLDWLARLYAHDTLMFIRREFDTQGGTINLLKLLGEMRRRPQVMNRARYRGFFATTTLPEYVADQLANRYFDGFKVTKGLTAAEDHLSVEQIEEDLTKLESQIEVVLEFANRMLAHRTHEWAAPSINVPNDLDPPLDAIRACFDAYYLLLTGISMTEPTPAILFDWTECFRHPWATSEYFVATDERIEDKRVRQSQTVLDRLVKRRGS